MGYQCASLSRSCMFSAPFRQSLFLFSSYMTASLHTQTRYMTEHGSTSSILRDTHQRQHTYLRISLTEKCNLRCMYCMPEDGVTLSPSNKLLTTSEIKTLVALFHEHGINKVRYTGGEPTLRADLPHIIEYTSKMTGIHSIGITSNGIVLHRQLPELVRSGLTHVNLSLDTLDPNKFAIITKRNGHDKVLRSLKSAVDLGVRTKLNVVVIKNVNDDEILKFADLSKNMPITIRFIEYMPFDGNRWNDKKLVSYRTMLDTFRRYYGDDFYALPLEDNHTAKLYGIKGHQGTIGFITSMTEHFCGTCNRLRITADGNLKVCLFGNEEVSLRDALRNHLPKAEINSLIATAVMRKKARHAGTCNSNRTYVPLSAPKLLANKFLQPSRLSKVARLRSSQRVFARCFTSSRILCTVPTGSGLGGLSHVDANFHPTMVDVSGKPVTMRSATAQALVKVPSTVFQQLRREGDEIFLSKGPVFATAIIAGTMASKRTSELIPFCHPLFIEQCHFEIHIDCDTSHIPLASSFVVIRIECTVNVSGKTGVEMEALVGATVASLTVYDMLKAASHDIELSAVKLLHKSGGKSGFTRPSSAL